ncbi:sialoadhesin isoform X2 [Ascaphus truei]|uniref:sialoadhesin isoform X2 n=1 Tax=Ascaphus truei TaxID=8439 RepID=UPI003F5AB41D
MQWMQYTTYCYARCTGALASILKLALENLGLSPTRPRGKENMQLLQFHLLVLFYIQGIHGTWDVQCPEKLAGVIGSCLLIPCSFSFPSDTQTSKGISMMWFKDIDAQRTVVYHPNEALDAAFQGRVEMLGDSNQKNCTILIKSLRKEDTGKYNFRFEIKEVNSWSDKEGVYIQVTDEPQTPDVVIPPDISDGVSASFQCSTPYFCPDGSTALNWLDYVQERSFWSRNVQLSTTGVLISQNLTASFTWQENQKRIRCEVTVGDRKAVKDVILNVKHSPKGVDVLIKPSAENIKQGDAVILTCHVNSSNPAVSKYTWYKDGQLHSGEEFVSFHSISRNDYGDYRCEVQNTFGTGVSETVQLVVFSAKTLVSPHSEIREGEAVTLTCEVPGAKQQEVNYSWFKNNIWIKEGSVRSIMFHEVAVADAGYYYCKIQNDKGSDSSPPIILNVLYPPRIPTMTSFLEVQEGKLAIIHCNVDSNPVSELMLYRNGHLIFTTTSHSAPNQRLSVTSTRNSLKLEIQNVVLSDEGNYSCSAQNRIGNSTTSLHFSVETARVVITPFSEIVEGNEVTLACLATRSSQRGTTYTWFKNGKWLKEDSENKLIFQRVSSRDAGSYYCKTHSPEGSRSSTSHPLRVLFPPKDISMTSLLATQGENLGVIQCTVDSDPHSELFLYRKETLVASSVMVLPNKRFKVSPSTNSVKLEIQDVLMEDEGTYTCFANNTYGHATGSLEFTAETKIVIEPSSQVHEGDPVNFTCAVSSISKEGMYRYTWYKNSAFYSEGPQDVLAFQHVTSSDSGSYYCRVWKNESSKSSSYVSLHVVYAPRNTQLRSFLDTEEGKLAFIHCTVDSYPPAELSLYRQTQLVASTQNHSTFNQRHSVSYSSNALKLDIRNVMQEDEGKYTCTSTNTIGLASESIYFRVQTARILVTPATEILEGGTVTLACDVTRTQLEGTTYTWYKNSRWLQDTNDNSLQFDQIKSGDTGYYHCKAQDTQGSSVSPSVSVHVLYAPREPIISSFWETQGGQIGIIQCSVDSDPPSRLALYRKDTLVGSSDSSTTPNQRMTISSAQNSLKLEIRDVMVEDEGMYLCTANNAHGNSTSTINYIAQTARVLVTPASVIPEGETVNMTCALDTGEPDKASYRWYKNGKRYPEGGTTKTLLFDNVSSNDGGSYYCTANSDVGAKSSSSITLNVLYAPRNAWIKSFLETRDGKVAIILCSVNSNPPSELTLYKEGELLASSAAGGVADQRLHPSFSPDTLRLEITNVRLSDEGRYIFQAKNVHGTTTVSVNFTVEGARVLISPSTDLREGDSVSLTCDVLASTPSVTGYTWYKNSRWFQEGSLASLVFERVSSNDAGSYSCTAHSKEGTRNSPAATLRVLYPPRNLSLSSFLETQERRLGVIMCSVDSEPPSALSLHRGGEVVTLSSPRDSGNQRLKLTRNSLRMEIYDLTEEDQGTYVCRANSSLGTAETSIYFSVETARVMVVPSAELHEGASVTLTCEIPKIAHGTNYTWYKNNKWLKEGPEVSLMLPSVSSADGGSYHCLAKHGSGSSISPLVGINVLYAPRNLLMTSFLETHGREQGIILCSADSVPMSTIGLYRGDVLVASTSQVQADQGQRFWASSSYNYLRLEIRDITADDSGSYVCTANNTLGIATSSMVFNVKDGEILTYQVIAWVAIACVVILVASFVGLKYWKKVNRGRNQEKYSMQTDKQSIEMNNKELSENGNSY